MAQKIIQVLGNRFLGVERKRVVESSTQYTTLIQWEWDYMPETLVSRFITVVKTEQLKTEQWSGALILDRNKFLMSNRIRQCCKRFSSYERISRPTMFFFVSCTLMRFRLLFVRYQFCSLFFL